MKKIVLTSIIALVSITAFSQENKWTDPKYNPDNFTVLDGLKKKKMEKLVASGDTARIAAKKVAAADKKVYTILLPIVAYNPFTNVILGAGGNISTKFGDPKSTRFSNIVPSYTYTLNKQQTFRVNSNIYTNNNDYYVFSSLLWSVSPQATYGLGGNTAKDWQTLVEPQTVKIVARAYKKVKKNIYFGFNYNLDWKYKIEDISATDIQNIIANSPDAATASAGIEENFDGLEGYWANEDIDYDGFTNDFSPADATELQQEYYYTPFGEYPIGTGDESVASGIGVNFLIDSRDNVNSTYKGAYVNISYTYFGEWLGSTSNFSNLLIDARQHIPLNKNNRQVLAFWGMANLTFGDVPYFSLPRIGGDDWFASGRGYTAGRYVGEKLLYAETEYRINIWKWFGMATFVNAHSVTEESGKFEYINVAGGLGFRVRVLKSRTDINADLGVGKDGSSGLYLRFTQAF